MDELRIKILDDRATLPRRAHPTDAGLDLATSSTSTISIDPGETRRLPTGIAAEIPSGYFGIIRPRSSVMSDSLLVEGVVDSSYRGELFLVATNIGRRTIYIKSGGYIAQLIIIPCETPAITIVNELSQTARGTSGFGSSDK